MARENLSIKMSYQEQINLLSNENAGILFKALFAYKNNVELPKMDNVTNMLFSIFRQDLDAEMQKNERVSEIRSVAGKKGNLAKQANAEFAKNDLAKASKTSKCEKRESTFPLKESSKENNTLFVKENTPLYPPKGSGESKKQFFEKYGQFKRYANGKYPNMDFERLLKEFSKSSTLRKTISWKIIQDGYDNILTGAFRDKVDEKEEGRNLLAERDRYYRDLRNAEFDRVGAVQKKLLSFEEYARIDKRLREITIERAKAEISMDKETIGNLMKEIAVLTAQRREFIKEKGYTEEDIKVRERCKKCHDTGYTSKGQLCGCYKKGKTNEMG